MHRQNPAWDKSKPQFSLSPDTKPIELKPAKLYTLGVCEAKNLTKEGFIFGDFLGFSMAMKYKTLGSVLLYVLPI